MLCVKKKAMTTTALVVPSFASETPASTLLDDALRQKLDGCFGEIYGMDDSNSGEVFHGTQRFNEALQVELFGE